MESGRQSGEDPAVRPASEDLTIEHARDPDGRAVAGDALDETVLGIDGQDRLRLYRRRRSEGQKADQRSAPAISFWSLEWIADEPATNSPRSNDRSEPR